MRTGGIVRFVGTFVLLTVVGCAGRAHYVLKRQDGGVIGMASDTPLHRRQAEKLMKEHFPMGYTIEKEETVVTGTVTTAQQNTDTDHVGPFILDKRTTTTTNSHPMTEYRIFYRPN